MRRTSTARVAALVVALVRVRAGVRGASGGAPAAVAAPGAAAPRPTATPSTSASTAPTSVPTPTPTPTVPQPTGTPAPVPTPTSAETVAPPAPTPTGTATATPPATDEDDAGSSDAPVRRFASPPAVTTSSTPWAELLAALAVVVAGAVAVVALSTRRARDATPAEAAPHVADGDPATPAELLRLLVDAGEAMVDAGHTVSSVADTLADIAVAHGGAGAETVVLPTALLVTVPDGDGVATAAVSTGRRPLLLHQVDDLADVLRDATTGDVPPARTTAAIAFLRAASPPFGTMARLGGYLMLSVGLAALLGGSWVDLLVAGALGLAVGALQLAVGPVPSGIEVVQTVAVAFAVSIAVLLAARVVPDLGVLPALVAPLVLFLPGGLLTTGVIELATGQMLSGGGRVAAGTMQLVLLAGGIVAAAALVGVPAVDLAGGGQALGPIAPWIGVVLFGVGTVVFRCGRPRTVGWVVVVLSVAYGAQVLGDALLGGVLSAFVGALAMTPVALAVARFPSGPSPLASFLPAFWMLVPGALGLVGVTSLLEGDSSGVSTLVTTVATMVAIAFGVVLGLAATRALPGPARRQGSVGGVPGVRPAHTPADPPV
ncbi:threonine/serine ThrE exporter family protein [Cellulomonas sp. Marseille-Q8402]